jgi:hypothetical protein
MAQEKQKNNAAALRHQKHFWGSLLLGLFLWIVAAVIPVKYDSLIFVAITGGIFCGFYAFMVIATYDSMGRPRPSLSQIQQETRDLARLSLEDEIVEIEALPLDDEAARQNLVSR